MERTISETIKHQNGLPLAFFYNGIKDYKGAPLQKVHYSKGGYTTASGLCFETITIYDKDYASFSAKIKEAFVVVNDTEIITDYIMKDHIRVAPSHPLYKDVNAAFEKQQIKREAA